MPVNSPESTPKSNEHPAVWDLYFEHIAPMYPGFEATPEWLLELVTVDIKERDEIGEKKYGVRLQPHNGRRPLVDAYQETLDLIVYTVQAWYEETDKELQHQLYLKALMASGFACFFRNAIREKYGD